jgi:hypothetical protein
MAPLTIAIFKGPGADQAPMQAAGRPKRIRPAGTKRYAGQVESALH